MDQPPRKLAGEEQDMTHDIPLPYRFDVVTRGNPDTGGYIEVPVWSSVDMHAYATQRERDAIERCAQICECFDACDPKYIAVEIRALLEKP
jgi:hypothetical protein